MDELTLERFGPVRPHVLHQSGHRDHRGQAICTCGSTADASIHRVREVSDDERAAEARRMGER